MALLLNDFQRGLIFADGISSSSLSHISFLIPRNPLHIILQPLLAPRSGINVLRWNNAFRHPTAWPSLTNPTQDPLGKHCSMEGAFIMRSSLMFSKFP